MTDKEPGRGAEIEKLIKAFGEDTRKAYHKDVRTLLCPSSNYEHQV